ncbi:MAG: PUR family DNA/RNA-binding protein [Weeksellaceae bacterium]
MSENENFEQSDIEGIYSKVLRAGKRTYFFDVRETRAGDYYLTVTESKRVNGDNGSYSFKKHKIYLYKEDFGPFKEMLDDVTSFILQEKGEEVISERHQKDYEPYSNAQKAEISSTENTESFTDLNFDDI